MRIVYGVLALVGALAAGCPPFRQPQGTVERELRRLVAAEAESRPGEQAQLEARVRRFYAGRRFEPAWTDGRRATADARELLRAIAGAPREGLDPADYRLGRLDSLVRALEPGALGPSPGPRELAGLDRELTRAFLAYAAHLAHGRPAGHAEPGRAFRERPELTTVLSVALERRDVGGMLERLCPKDAVYCGLRGTLARYRQDAAAASRVREVRGAADPEPILPGPPLERGSRGARVAALAARLAASGDLHPSRAGAQVLDPVIERALRSFQARHGLVPDGRAEAPDLWILNLPVADRIRAIERAMDERRRRDA